MGTFITGMFDVDDDHTYRVYTVNMPESAAAMLAMPELRMDITHVPEADAERVRQQIADREVDLLIIFPPNFDQLVAGFDPYAPPGTAPNIEVWSNTARSESMEARTIVTGILYAYHQELTQVRFTINAPAADAPDGNFDMATDADIFGMFLGFLIPMMFLIFIYTGCLAIAPESISGEKERGTLGGILVTPAKRSHIALGKIISISMFALLGAIGSIIGMALSMPSMMGMERGALLEFYTFADLGMLMLVASSTTLVFVSILSVLSAYAKSVKEATAYATPIMLVATLCGLASTILGRIPTEPLFYLLPIFNSALSLSAIVSFEVSVVNMAITAGVNILFTLICAVVLAKIFDSEKIVFS